MDIKQFEQIKSTIALAEERYAKATGVIESIEEEWQDTYDFSTYEKAQEKLSELKAVIDTQNQKVDKLWAELCSAQDWDNV